MEKVLVSVSTGAMQSLLGKLEALLGEEYKLQNDVRGDIDYMKRELEAMEAFLLRMSERSDHDEQAKLWIRDVRELSYDIEDRIDEFILLLDREANSSSKHHGLIMMLVGKCKNKISEITTRREIVKEMKEIKKQIDETTRRHKRYKIDEANSMPSKVTVDPRVCNLYKDVSQLVGIDGPRDELIKLLTEEDVDAPAKKQLKVVSIVGSAGLGKTTLSKQVYDKLKQNFECSAFVSVSQNPDITMVLREILSKVSGDNYANTEAGSEEQLISKVAEYLSNKRYFVVVDDIWDTEMVKIIKCALQNNSQGSRVITTTRISDVAKMCWSSNGNYIFNIKPLNDVDSRSLFLRRIFGPKEICLTHLEAATSKILKKCGGIPLAIITISSMLSEKPPTEEKWNRVEKSIGSVHGNGTEIDIMRRILSLSYFDLPYHLRTCFLYLSIFPEDHIIVKECLILRWIAEGFIQEDGKDVREVGEDYFNELINRSLIQPWDMDQSAFETTSCRVHDVILGFIIAKSVEENFVTLCGASELTPAPQNKIRRLSIQYCDQGCVVEQNTLHHVRSLDVFESASQIPSLSNFKSLRVLGMRQLLFTDRHLLNIGKLYHLKYLCLEYVSIEELPEEIGELQYLETLDVSRCSWMRKLPSTITRLQGLVRLFVSHETTLPDDIGELKNLQELKAGEVSTDSSPNFIRSLGELSKLRTLSIWCSGEAKQYEEKLVASLCKLGDCNLHSLTVYNPPSRLFELWCLAAPNLRELAVHFEELVMFPRWAGSLQKLQKLAVHFEEVRQEDIDIIAGIPGLIFLKIDSYSCFDERIVISGGGRFEYLKSFSYQISYGPMGLLFEAGAMPMLTHFHLEFWAKWTKGQSCGGLDFGIQQLSNLAVINVSLRRPYTFNARADKKVVDDLKSAITNACSTLPNHPFPKFYMM